MSFLIAQIVSERELARRGHDVEAAAVGDVLFAALLGTMIGAKLYYVVVVTHNIRDLWSRGGFVFWGGFIGSVIAVLRRRSGTRSCRFPRFADVAGIAIAAGYAVGRTGCWAVGDDYGKPYNGPLAVAFPAGRAAVDGRRDDAAFHVPSPPGADPEHGGVRLSDAAVRSRDGLHHVRRSSGAFATTSTPRAGCSASTACSPASSGSSSSSSARRTIGSAGRWG